MKIMPVLTNTQYAKNNFKAVTAQNETPQNSRNTNSGCFGSFPYWALLSYAMLTSGPAMKLADKLTGEEDIQTAIDSMMTAKQENFEKCLDLSGEFEKVNGLSVAHHPLRTLSEVDDAEFTTTENGLNIISFKTDDKIISLSAKADSKDKTKMTGEFISASLDNPSKLEKYTYNARFSKDNSTVVKIQYTDEKEKTKSVVLKRENDGSLFVVKNGKKTKINSKNVDYHKKFIEKYQEISDAERNKPDNKFLYLILLLMTFNRIKSPKRREN